MAKSDYFGQQLIDLTEFGTITNGSTKAGLYEFIRPLINTKKEYILKMGNYVYNIPNIRVSKGHNNVTNKDFIQLQFNMNATYLYILTVTEEDAVTIANVPVGGQTLNKEVISFPYSANAFTYDSTTKTYSATLTAEEATAIRNKIIATSGTSGVTEFSGYIDSGIGLLVCDFTDGKGVTFGTVISGGNLSTGSYIFTIEFKVTIDPTSMAVTGGSVLVTPYVPTAVS